jgi:hypothetical protein
MTDHLFTMDHAPPSSLYPRRFEDLSQAELDAHRRAMDSMSRLATMRTQEAEAYRWPSFTVSQPAS